MWKSVLGVVILAAAAAPAQTPPRNLRSLPPTTQPRFEVTDGAWPANEGEAQVCLWRDDRLAAASITIDDNHVQDHRWWMEMGQKYGFRFTWFVITFRVGKGEHGGTWDDFAKLKQAGHDIQSHTVDHFNPRTGKALPTERNYAEAIPAIEQHVPGARVLAMAYPGGPSSKGKNDPEIAVRYYIAARGGNVAINPANQINYQKTNSIGGQFPVTSEHKPGLPNAIELNPRFPEAYRGWACFHFHDLGDKGSPDASPNATPKDVIVGGLEYLSRHKDAFWVAPFAEVMQYSQERDTASLESKKTAAGQWQLTLSDRMDDAFFDFPLTIKMRIDSAWQHPTARQGAQKVPVSVVEHGGAKYALIEAIPDRGVIAVTGE